MTNAYENEFKRTTSQGLKGLLNAVKDLKKTRFFIRYVNMLCIGKGGIRTPGDRKATPIFKIGAINHSATFPKFLLKVFYILSKIYFV